jgi:flagellar basal body-associated protein FliL
MTTDTESVAPVANIDKLVAIYIKIRDARDAIRKEAEAKEADLEAQLDVIEQSILELCKDTGATSIKTEHGKEQIYN